MEWGIITVQAAGTSATELEETLRGDPLLFSSLLFSFLFSFFSSLPCLFSFSSALLFVFCFLLHLSLSSALFSLFSSLLFPSLSQFLFSSRSLNSCFFSFSSRSRSLLPSLLSFGLTFVVFSHLLVLTLLCCLYFLVSSLFYGYTTSHLHPCLISYSVPIRSMFVSSLPRSSLSLHCASSLHPLPPPPTLESGVFPRSLMLS